MCVKSQYILHTKSEKAKKLYGNALDLYMQQKLNEAFYFAKKAEKKDTAFIENLILLAQIYQDTGDTSQTLKYYTKTLNINDKLYPEIYIYRGDIYSQKHQFKRAKKDFLSLKKMSSDTVIQKRLEKRLKSVQIMDSLCRFPLKFKPVNMGSMINSDLDEYSPLLSFDNENLIFTRAQSRNELHREDIFFSKNLNGNWTKAQRAGQIFNTSGNEGSPSISANNNYLVFASCNRPDGFGRCDIYITEFNGKNWGKPKNMGKNVNSRYWESQACLSADGSQLYLVSNLPKGYGKTDIWMCKKNEEAIWSKPKNLGSNINTSGGEYFPFLHASGKRLYFSSDGIQGMGKTDIFYSDLDSSGKWTKAKNLGYPVNSSFDDNGIFISADGNTALISTNRFNPQKGMDIYKFELDEKIKPIPAFQFEAKVVDAETNQNIEAKILIKNSENLLYSTTTQLLNGKFRYIGENTDKIQIYISSLGYIFLSAEIENPFQKSNTIFKLKKLKNQSKSIFHFQFEFNSDKLHQSDLETLNYLSDFLKRNPKIKISIEGHTDNVGIRLFNQKLSAKRAASVLNYLLQKGIPKARMQTKAYGASKPLVPNNNTKNKALNRRTEIIYLTN